jgi:hypothetical protein
VLALRGRKVSRVVALVALLTGMTVFVLSRPSDLARTSPR